MNFLPMIELVSDTYPTFAAFRYCVVIPKGTDAGVTKWDRNEKLKDWCLTHATGRASCFTLQEGGPRFFAPNAKHLVSDGVAMFERLDDAYAFYLRWIKIRLTYETYPGINKNMTTNRNNSNTENHA